MDYETQTPFFQQLYPPKPLATFAVFINGKPKISPFPEQDQDTSDLANIESDDTILTDISSDPKFTQPPCDFDPSNEDYPKNTLFIYNTNAPSHFKSEDMAAQSIKKQSEDEEQVQERPRKSLDFIRLNKQLIRRMKKVTGNSHHNVKASPGISTTVTTAHRPLESLRESQSNVQRQEATIKNPTPLMGTTTNPLPLDTVESTRTTTSLVPIRPLRPMPQLPSNLHRDSARSFNRHQAALIDRCVRKVIRTKPLAPLTSNNFPSCHDTPSSSPKSILKSSRFPRSLEVNHDDTITLKGSQLTTEDETSSETGFQQGQRISNADREALRQYIMEQQESQRRRILQLRRKRPRRTLNSKPSSRPPPNHSSSMSLNISSTASDEDSGLEYTDEEFNLLSPY